MFLPSGNHLLKVICASMTVRLNYQQCTICLGVKPKSKKPPCLVQYAAVPRLNKRNCMYNPATSQQTPTKRSSEQFSKVCRSNIRDYLSSRNQEPQSSWLCAWESMYNEEEENERLLDGQFKTMEPFSMSPKRSFTKDRTKVSCVFLIITIHCRAQ